jgi:hypothetical protein
VSFFAIELVGGKCYIPMSKVGGELDSTGMRTLLTAYRGLRVHAKEAVKLKC